MRDEKDKRLIWEDCPQCAYKHLTAAYAALTSPGAQRSWDAGVSGDRVYWARALIAAHEYESGYVGNRDLELGCYAAAESASDCDIARKSLRDARLTIQRGQTPKIIPRYPGDAAMAAGHIAEAMRELPALADRSSLGCVTAKAYSEVREWVRQNILWVKETYELSKESEVPNVAS